MPLPVTVALIVLVVIVLVGLVGTLIENAEEKVEHGPTDRHQSDCQRPISWLHAARRVAV